ncbi:MAG: hypothetical protein AAF218_10345 [Pseudomonadota bacterium]
MPVTFHVLPHRGLLVVQASGHILLNDMVNATARYEAHPGFDPGQKQLVDLSAVTGFEADYPRFLAMQARKAARFDARQAQTLVVYVAPSPPAQRMATLFARTWDSVDAVVALVQHEPARALALLGQPETTLAALLRPVP